MCLLANNSNSKDLITNRVRPIELWNSSIKHTEGDIRCGLVRDMNITAGIRNDGNLNYDK